jgi:transcriptional regulator with XRE-family HTH domain
MKPTLKEYLKTTGQTYEVFAQKMGLTKQRIEQIVNGKDKLKIETACRIYEATDYEVRFSSIYPAWEKLRDTISHIDDDVKCESIGDKTGKYPDSIV